jgi:hypothetical protein
MRYPVILGALALAALIDGHAGSARAGTWCQVDGDGMILNCSFVTFQQCLDTVRGVGGGCQANLQPEPNPAPAPKHTRRKR